MDMGQFIIINFMDDKMIRFQLQLNHTMQFFFLILITNNPEITFLELSYFSN